MAGAQPDRTPGIHGATAARRRQYSTHRTSTEHQVGVVRLPPGSGRGRTLGRGVAFTGQCTDGRSRAARQCFRCGHVALCHRGSWLMRLLTARRGFALITVLWLVALLGTLAGGLLLVIRREQR